MKPASAHGRRRFALLLAIVLSAHICCGATLTVTTTDDSGPGSLRQAILDANADPGPNLVQFNLPGAGIQTLMLLSPLPDILSPTAIDGYTQLGSHPNTLAWDNDAVLLVRLDGIRLTNAQSTALTLRANGCLIRGLILVRFDHGIVVDSVSGNTIAGNWIGIDLDGIARGMTFYGVRVTGSAFAPAGNNLIGGEAFADRNVISGNQIGVSFFPEAAANNSVIGNFIGTDPSGRLPRGNVFAGVDIHAATNIHVLGNVLAASTGAGGCGVSLLGCSRIVIQRNLIGVSTAGGDVGHFSSGISAMGVSDFEIGGDDSALANRIDCNRSHGIELLSCAGGVIHGNVIGTGATGAEPLGNLGSGVYLGNISASNLVVGNTIVYNGGAGVAVTFGTGNRISQNYIYDNAGPGIDLGNDGPTPNDPGDPDAGANELQNYPTIISAQVTTGSIQVQASLQSRPATTYQLEFFASVAWDPLWQAEGQVYLGSTTLTTDAAGLGVASFTAPAPTWLGPDDLITATATDPAGNTSEFAQAGRLAIEPPLPSLQISRAGKPTVITWPSSARAAGFQLESALAELVPQQWDTLSSGISDDGTTCTLTIPDFSSANARLFRLRRAVNH